LFPAVRVQEDYRDIDDIIRMCMLRIRVPEQWKGDYLAALGAARIGERELLSLGDELGWDVLEDFIESWFDYSEKRMQGAISKLPSGRVTASSIHDPFPGTPPEGIAINATVEVDPDAALMSVDLTDNPDCMPCGFNLSEACARTAAMVGVFNGLGINIPTNAGSFRRININLRENCIVGIPRFPASCSVATTNVADRVTNAVQTAIADLGDGFGMAEVGAISSSAAANLYGHDPRHGSRPYVNEICLGDTNGAASPRQDGWLTISHIGTAGLMLLDSVEIDELRHPLKVHTRRLIPDSEGAGRYRGAPGLHTEYGPRDCSVRVMYAGDGMINAAKGVRGGGSGAPLRVSVRRLDGSIEEAPAWGDFDLVSGESVIGMSCGGGGYGRAQERNPARVCRDLREGYITRERAESVYSVVVDAAGEVDADATRLRRQRDGSNANDPCTPPRPAKNKDC
ncbi:MAG: hydantoinase B/oxoprolinase family protein, partial [Rhodospirillaceae bacterium]|nr:hydantoinase B/oxoprolinase family protein [Rhodospirillaceae bacterium]